MNKITTLTVLLALFVSTASASVWINEDSISITPSNPEVGQEVTVSFSASTDDRRVEQMGVRFAGGEWQMRDCDLTTCGEPEVGNWTHTFTSSGSKQIELKATSSNFQADEATWSDTISVSEDSSVRYVTFTNLPDEFHAGETYDISARAYDSEDRLWNKEFKIEERGPSGSWSTLENDPKVCFPSSTTTYDECTITRQFSPSSGGNYDLRASITTGDGVTLSEQTTVSVISEDLSVDISSISATNEEIGEGDSTRLSARLEANQGTTVDVLFKVGGNIVARKNAQVLDPDTGRYVSRTIDWDSLPSSLKDGNSHDVTVEVSNYGYSNSATSQNLLTVLEEESLSVGISDLSSSQTEIGPGDSTELSATLSANQGTTVDVEFKIGGNVVASRSAVALSSGSDSYISETVSWSSLPSSLKNGNTHDLTVKVSNYDYSNSVTSQNLITVLEEEGLSIDVSNIQSSQSTLDSGETTTLSADLDSNQGTTVEAVFKIDSTEVGTVEAVTLTDSQREVTLDVSWSSLPSNLKDGNSHDVTVEARHVTEGSFSNTASNILQINAAPGGVELSNLMSTSEEIRQGEATQFKVDVLAYQNFDNLNVDYYVDGQEVVTRTAQIDEGEEKTVRATISWNELTNYVDAGNTYDLEVRVSSSNLDGNPSLITEDAFTLLAVEQQPPTARFSWDDHPVVVGNSARFDASASTDPNDDIQSYRWNFRDGSSYKYGVTKTHTFSSPGTYDVKLRVTDSEGNQHTKIRPVEVVEAPGECSLSIGSLNLQDDVIEYGGSTQASLRITNNGDPQQFRVKFKVDGNVVRTVNREISSGSSSRFTASVSPIADGTVTAQIETIGDPCGERTYNRYKSITVIPGDDGDNGEEGQKPDPSFSWSPSQPQPDQEVTFDASATTDPQSNIDTYKWFFGDGSAPSYGESVTHTYTSTGDYDVQLVVNDTDGNSRSLTRTVPVRWSAEACSVQVSSLNLDSSYITYGDSTSASVTVSNLGNQQAFTVKFKESGNVVHSREVVIDSNSQRTFSKLVSPEGDGFITAKIETSEPPCGFKEWTRSKQLLVIPSGDSGQESTTLQVNVKNSEGRRLQNARVAVERPSGENIVRYTGSSGNANFGLSEGTFDVSVSKSGYSSEFRTVSLNQGQHRTVTVTLDQAQQNEGTLIALVEDGNGTRLENAQVRVEDGVDITRSTDSNGRAEIGLQAGSYTVTAEKAGYGEMTKSVQINANQQRTKVFHLTGGQGLEITNINYPSSVCRGSTMKAQVTIENMGGLHQFISLTGSGLGSINVVSSFSMESGSKVTKTLYFTNVQGSGSKEFTVTVSNHDTEKAGRTVQVNECPTPVTQKPSDISLTVGYTKRPQMAVAGDIIKVDGFVDGVNGRSTVDIMIDDEVKATVNTNPGGYYQTWITAQDVGPHTIKAKAGEATATKPLRIIPTSQVTAIEAPVSVFESQEYQVCAQVDSQIEPEVVLVRDGAVVTSKQAKGKVCFNRTARQPGMHKYEIAALTSGEGNKASTTVEVLKMDKEASSFPNQIASVESGSGLVKVELYNNNEDQKEYDLKLEGLPSTWIAQSEKSVILQKGQRKTVYFYLTPQEEGSYKPTITVNSEGSQVYQEELDVITGGTTDSTKKNDGFFHNFVEGLSSFFSF